MKDVFKYFGGKLALARLLNVSPSAVTQWTQNGLPSSRAIEIEKLSNGKFKAVDIMGAKDDDL